MGGGGGGGGNDGVEYQRQQEEERQARIRQGMYQIDSIFDPSGGTGGFNDAYYQKRSKAYKDFALPQLQDQFNDQQKSLTYALSRGGNLGSSVGAAKNADLAKDFALQKQAVNDTGQDYANKARADVADQKQNLISLLQASADPDATANLAQSQARNLSAMPAFSPLSPVISNVASGLGSYLMNQQTADAVKKAYSDSYSNPLSSNSGKVG